MPLNDDSPTFMRPLSPHGKLLWELKTKVDEDTATQFKAICEKSGGDVASVLRDYVFLIVHGETETDMVIREANAKREMMMGTPVGRALERVREICAQ